MPKPTSPIRVVTKALRPAVGVFRVPVPEADEGVGAETHPFPAQVEKQQVVRQGDHQHGEDEEVQVAEIPGVVLIFPHEGDGIEVNDAGDKGHHEGHDGRQGIVKEAQGRSKLPPP